MGGTTRTAKIELRVTPDEKKAIEGRAEEAGEDVSKYLRRRALAREPGREAPVGGSPKSPPAAGRAKLGRRADEAEELVDGGATEADSAAPQRFDRRVRELSRTMPASGARRQALKEGLRP